MELPNLSSDLLLTDMAQIDITMLNQKFRQLLENDIQLANVGKDLPGIWEQRWYNEQSDASLYYKKGSCVWLNTESIDDVVRSRELDLYSYAHAYPSFKKQLDELVARRDLTTYFIKLKEFAEGKLDHTKYPIFVVGDLMSPAQVRVSKVDNNNEPPTNDEYWEDFIVNCTADQIQDQVISTFNSYADAALRNHISGFHLDVAEYSKNSLSDTYLLTDFSNINGQQELRSHNWHVNPIKGLDHVKRFQKRIFANGNIKWYRLWNSGFLEHGGIVDMAANLDGGDTRHENLYTVRLDWTDSDGKQVVYDYPTAGFDGFYSGLKFSLGMSITNIPKTYLGKDRRYAVTLTRINCDEPYKKTARLHTALDACFFNNDSFSILNTSRHNTVSYYIEGYTIQGRKY